MALSCNGFAVLYKRSNKPGSHWWVRFEIKGQEVRQSSGTDRREAAEAFEQDLRHEIWNQKYLGIVEEDHTWEEACERWLKDKAHKRSLDRDRQAIRSLHIQGNMEIGECARLPWLQTFNKGDGPAARERAVFRGVLNAAVKWGWLDKAPKVEMPHEEKHDPRWITKEQFEKLRKELPRHAAQLARFGVATGLRQSNVFRLKWSAVGLGRRMVRVGSHEIKSAKGSGFPLNADARRILKEQVGAHAIYVFTDDRGRAPIGSIKTAWLKAVKRAGLEGFRFHDLRHTWAAWHTLSGTPPIVLKELGGWSSLAMVERYSHLNPGHLAAWADNSSTKTGTRKGKRSAKHRRK